MTPEDLRARFRQVIAPFRPKPPEAPTPAPVDPARLRAEAACDWASDKRAAHLDRQIEEMHRAAHSKALESRLTHAETTFWIGYQAALDDLRTLLTAWRDNRTPAPHEKGQVS